MTHTTHPGAAAAARPAGTGPQDTGGASPPAPPPSAAARAGFCRVTVRSPDRRVDLILPEDPPLAALLADIHATVGHSPTPDEPSDLHLVRLNGHLLDPELPLRDQDVRDGETLLLRPLTHTLPAPVHDDLPEALAATLADARPLWHPRLLRPCGSTAAALLFAAPSVALARAYPPSGPDGTALALLSCALAVALLLSAGVLPLRRADQCSALAFGLPALPYAALASTAFTVDSVGRPVDRLLPCALAVLLAGACLTAMRPNPPFVAVTAVAATAATMLLAAAVTGASAVVTSAVTLVTAVGALAFLPGLCTRLARLPLGLTVAADRPAVPWHVPQPRSGPPPIDPLPIDPAAGTEALDAADHEPDDGLRAAAARSFTWLLGLLACCAVTIVGCATLLTLRGAAWATTLTLVAGVATVCRARLFDTRAAVLCLLTAGCAAWLAVALVGEWPAAYLPLALLAAACVLLYTAVLAAPRDAVLPSTARLVDRVETCCLLSLVPLCLGVADLYRWVRELAG